MTIKQDDIFSLFDIEVETKKVDLNKMNDIKENKPKLKTDTNSSSTKSSTNKKDNFKLTSKTIIRFGMNEYPVTNYFSKDEIERGLPSKKTSEDGEIEYKPISEEQLRKKLEKDFPILVPKYTTLVYVEKQDVVIPIMQAKKNGSMDNKEFSFEDSSLKHQKKKIPFQILLDFIHIAKYFSDNHGSEVFANIYFDHDTEEFFMDIPSQRVSRYLVTITEEAQETALKLIERRYSKVMEIHSHHILSPTPSKIDDDNQRAPILYAIIGNINGLFPDVLVRTFNKELNEHIIIDSSKVFEFTLTTKQKVNGYDLTVVEVE